MPTKVKLMNIFILDKNIKKCAQYHCDQHVVKMILESVQLMCTCLNKKGFKTPYKSTHTKHPCVLWLEESYDNMLWLQNLTTEFNLEYKYRYGKDKDHASIRVLDEIRGMKYDSKGLTPFAQAMPDQYKVENNPVKAYRQFYRKDKMRFAKWTKRKKPAWV